MTFGIFDDIDARDEPLHKTCEGRLAPLNEEPAA
jgi:hypothetical protein